MSLLVILTVGLSAQSASLQDNTKLRGAVDMLEGRDDTQRNIGRLERLACAYLRKLGMQNRNTDCAEKGLKTALRRRI